MPTLLTDQDPEFARKFEEFLELKRDTEASVDEVVKPIIADVRARGIAAVIELTAKFDNIKLTAETVAFTQAEINGAVATVPQEQREALELAADRIRAFHLRQLPEAVSWEDDAGAMLGWRWTPVDAAGLYVPGGLASYPSSVLMNAIAAKVAGVRRLAMAVPTPGGATNPLVLLAAEICGVDQIFRIGGAQAIAALAYGATPIEPVDMITGPGNAYVAAAKRQVFGHVGIDMIAGPSEVLIIADAEANPEWVALDLMAQAEHDTNAQAVLITNDAALAHAVEHEVSRLLETLERRDIAGESWRNFGAIITVGELSSAIELTDRIAPEHLEIQTADPARLGDEIRHAGAIFLGGYTPEAIGDYVGGPNHVLPTAGSARFSSGLSVMNFMKRTTLSAMSPGALRQIGGAAATLARSESLEAHALSVEKRLGSLN